MIVVCSRIFKLGSGEIAPVVGFRRPERHRPTQQRDSVSRVAGDDPGDSRSMLLHSVVTLFLVLFHDVAGDAPDVQQPRVALALLCFAAHGWRWPIIEIG